MMEFESRSTFDSFRAAHPVAKTGRRPGDDAQDQDSAEPDSFFSFSQTRFTGRGAPLSGALRQDMERELHADFSGVSLRRTSEAARLGALGWVRGEEMVIDPAAGALTSGAGRGLLKHELRHVLQQRAGRVKADTRIGGFPASTDPQLEAEADRAGGVSGAHAAEAPGVSENVPPAPPVLQGYFVSLFNPGQPLTLDQIEFFLKGLTPRQKRHVRRNAGGKEVGRPIEDLIKEAKAGSVKSARKRDDTPEPADEDVGASSANKRRRSGKSEAEDEAPAQTAPPPTITGNALANASGLPLPATTSLAATPAAQSASSSSSSAPAEILARAIIWNVNHFGKLTRRNTAKLKNKSNTIEKLLQSNPDVVLLNEVNAGVGALEKQITAANRDYAFETGPEMQALGKKSQIGQKEYYPLMYRTARYEYLGAHIATDDAFEGAGESYQWQKSKNRSEDADALPGSRPLVIYRLRDRITREEHWYGAVHTTPAGNEFSRTAVYSQVEGPLKQAQSAAAKAKARLFVGGDYYLTPEAVVRKGGAQKARNAPEKMLSAQLNLAAIMQGKDPKKKDLFPQTAVAGSAGDRAAAAQTLVDPHIAAPAFATNLAKGHYQVADLGVAHGWPGHRPLLPNLQNPDQPQNVDTTDQSYSTPLFETSDHLPVMFDLAASTNPLAPFTPRPPHPDAAQELQRTLNRAMVLKTLALAAQSKPSAIPAAQPPGSAKYVDIVAAHLAALKKMKDRTSLESIDASTAPAEVVERLKKAGFESAVSAVQAETTSNFSVHDFETTPDIRSQGAGSASTSSATGSKPRKKTKKKTSRRKKGSPSSARSDADSDED